MGLTKYLMTQRPPLINPAFQLEFQVPRFMIVLLVVTLTAATSCRRSDRPQMVPVTGTVYHNGKLLEGATVGFMGSVGRPSSGITDALGRFRLSTWEEGDGAAIGQHVVTIVKAADPKFSPKKNPDGSYIFRSQAEQWAFYDREMLLPARYSSAMMTDLSATVTEEGPNDFTFKMTDE